MSGKWKQVVIGDKLKEEVKSFTNEWDNCENCQLCKLRSKVVLYRGTVPCEVLFVGEAPGESENVLGLPFVGPAGDLLEFIIQSVFDELEFSWAITNLVACVPYETDYSLRQPYPFEIESCASRLQKFESITLPLKIVALGNLAKKYLRRFDISMVHPAGILRKPESSRYVATKREILKLQNLVKGLYNDKSRDI